MNRRKFFKITALGSGGLMLSTFFPIGCTTESHDIPDWEPNFFIRINPNNQITFICPQAEIGQGTSTGLAMIAADELGARLEDLKIEFAVGSEEKYGDLQDTGGSNGLRMLWKPLREAAATTREILKQSAAIIWEEDISNCYTKEGFVYHLNTSKRISFGNLLKQAGNLPAPQDIPLKALEDFQYIGKPIIGYKTKLAAKGETPYSINKTLPNMVYAAVERCPVWGGSLVSFDDAKARKFPGVIDVFEIEAVELGKDMDYKGGVRPGVVVVAENTWAAFEGKKALKIEWEGGKNSHKTENHLRQELVESVQNTTEITHDFKNAQRLLKQEDQLIEAKYEIPFQTNACMEPLNAVAYHKGYEVEIWVGTQAPKLTRQRIAEVTGLPEAAVTVHPAPSGGGFGRRYFIDFVEEAVTISEKLRRPVKVTWSREDTIATSKYHPFRTEHWNATLDKNNHPVALSYKGVVGQPSGFRPFPYSIPTAFHQPISYKEGNLLPRSSWRSVFAHHWGLGLECFMDELAHRAGKDPIQFRLEYLENAEVVAQKFSPWVGDDLYPHKLKRTLEVVAEKASWNQPTREGRYKGVSAFCYNTSYCSQVAEISIENKQVTVHKVTVVLDCGLAVNPSQVKAQVEGSVMWGLGATLKDPITVKNGRVQQRNFESYDLLRMSEAPEVDVYILPSEDTPSGTGEPVVPGVAPAVLNAVFATTGIRIRKLPIDLTDLAS